MSTEGMSLLEDLLSRDKEWVLDLEGEILLITVPTACKVEPVIDCFLEGGWDPSSFGV